MKRVGWYRRKCRSHQCDSWGSLSSVYCCSALVSCIFPWRTGACFHLINVCAVSWDTGQQFHSCHTLSQDAIPARPCCSRSHGNISDISIVTGSSFCLTCRCLPPPPPHCDQIDTGSHLFWLLREKAPECSLHENSHLMTRQQPGSGIRAEPAGRVTPQLCSSNRHFPWLELSPRCSHLRCLPSHVCADAQQILPEVSHNFLTRFLVFQQKKHRKHKKRCFSFKCCGTLLVHEDVEMLMI